MRIIGVFRTTTFFFSKRGTKLEIQFFPTNLKIRRFLIFSSFLWVFFVNSFLVIVSPLLRIQINRWKFGLIRKNWSNDRMFVRTASMTKNKPLVFRSHLIDQWLLIFDTASCRAFAEWSFVSFFSGRETYPRNLFPCRCKPRALPHSYWDQLKLLKSIGRTPTKVCIQLYCVN